MEGATTFVCKSQECPWQDWYILILILSQSLASLSEGEMQLMSLHQSTHVG